MKVKSLTLILLITFIGCNTVKDPNQIISIAADKMNVLYIGVENPITVAVSGVKSSNLNVMIDNGEIKGENGKYVVMPEEPGVAIITIKKGDTNLGEVAFRIKTVPNPVASLGDKTGGQISLDELKNINKIEVLIPEFVFDVEFSIKSFDLEITHEGWNVRQYSDSENLTPEQLELLTSRLKAGEKLYILNIIAQGPDSSERKLPPLIFDIVE